MAFKFKSAGLAAVLALSASNANAVTFASYEAASGAANITLSGTTLSASAPVLFDYTFPSALAAFGFVDANLTLSATETGAAGFGPLAFGGFNGSFSIDYAGAGVTIGGITLSHGEVLLAGIFHNALFDAMGGAGSLIDSISGGGAITYANSALLNFSGTSSPSFTIGLTDINPAVWVSGGQLSSFTGVSQGEFASDSPVSVASDVPEPATWGLMLLGFISLGLAGHGRGRMKGAPATAA